MSTNDSQAIISIARQLRAVLPRMDEQAQALIPRLDALLARADAGEDVDSRILELLASHPKLRDWLRQALPYQEEVMGVEDGRGAALPGDPDVRATAYECPVCGWTYYLPQAGFPVPRCPRDGSPLRPKRRKR